MNKDKKIFVELAIVVILVVVGFWIMGKSSTAPVVDKSGAEVTPVEDVSEGSVNVGVPAASISYTQALTKYKDARIQLDMDCRANPNNATYKNNSSIMIDNRSDKVRTIKVGTTFSIKAYGFKIVNLSSATLPTTWYVDCDGSQNVATILIQK